MLTVTTAAAAQIRAAAEDNDAVGMALRVAARRADDGSIEYGMGFDETHDDDEPLDFGDLTVVVSAGSSRTLLTGTTLDFVEIEPGNFRFIFVPGEPEAASASAGSCGSGGCSRCGPGC